MVSTETYEAARVALAKFKICQARAELFRYGHPDRNAGPPREIRLLAYDQAEKEGHANIESFARRIEDCQTDESLRVVIREIDDFVAHFPLTRSDLRNFPEF